MYTPLIVGPDVGRNEPFPKFSSMASLMESVALDNSKIASERVEVVCLRARYVADNVTINDRRSLRTGGHRLKTEFFH